VNYVYEKNAPLQILERHKFPARIPLSLEEAGKMEFRVYRADLSFNKIIVKGEPFWVAFDYEANELYARIPRDPLSQVQFSTAPHDWWIKDLWYSKTLEEQIELWKKRWGQTMHDLADAMEEFVLVPATWP
jgi:hypothetical protein